jgi:hypothetical protein
VFYPTEGFSSEVSGRSFHNGGHPAMVLVMAVCFRLLALKSAGAIWSFSFATSASDLRWRCRPLCAAAAAGDGSAAISDCPAGHRQAAAWWCATISRATPAVSWPKPARWLPALAYAHCSMLLIRASFWYEQCKLLAVQRTAGSGRTARWSPAWRTAQRRSATESRPPTSPCAAASNCHAVATRSPQDSLQRRPPDPRAMLRRMQIRLTVKMV